MVRPDGISAETDGPVRRAAPSTGPREGSAAGGAEGCAEHTAGAAAAQLASRDPGGAK